MLGTLVLKIHFPTVTLSVALRYERQTKISLVLVTFAKLLATISSNSIRNCLVTRKTKNVRFSASLFFTRTISIIIVVYISTIEFQTRLFISLFYLPVCIILSHTGKTRGEKSYENQGGIKEKQRKIERKREICKKRVIIWESRRKRKPA